MLLLQKTLLLLVTVMVAAAGSLPQGSVICQTLSGEVVIESNCDCKSEAPPCCSEDSHEEVSDDCHSQSFGADKDCQDTIISVDLYIKQNSLAVKKTASANFSDFNQFITLIAGEHYLVDYSEVPDIQAHDFPPFSSYLTIRTTVLII